MNLLGFTRASAPAAASVATSQQASDNVTISDGVQTVNMTQGPRGYEPADTVLYAGMPTKWVINATSQYDCSAFLRVPDLGQQINLTQGINTVDLSTLQAGVIPFTCVMGMYTGEPHRRRAAGHRHRSCQQARRAARRATGALDG